MKEALYICPDHFGNIDRVRSVDPPHFTYYFTPFHMPCCSSSLVHYSRVPLTKLQGVRVGDMDVAEQTERRAVLESALKKLLVDLHR